MKKNVIAAVFVMALLAGSMAAYAYRGDPTVPGPYCSVSDEVRAEIQEALAQGDYATWTSLREQYNLPMHGRIMQIANEENFDLISQLHNAVIAGDEETAAQIREELGLGSGMKYRHGMGGKRGFNN